MSRWRATMPRAIPPEGKADFVFAYRHKGIRFEYASRCSDKVAAKIMKDIVNKTKEKKK